jgi:hypothetical protein
MKVAGSVAAPSGLILSTRAGGKEDEERTPVPPRAAIRTAPPTMTPLATPRRRLFETPAVASPAPQLEHFAQVESDERRDARSPFAVAPEDAEAEGAEAVAAPLASTCRTWQTAAARAEEARLLESGKELTTMQPWQTPFWKAQLARNSEADSEITNGRRRESHKAPVARSTRPVPTTSALLARPRSCP